MTTNILQRLATKRFNKLRSVVQKSEKNRYRRLTGFTGGQVTLPGIVLIIAAFVAHLLNIASAPYIFIIGYMAVLTPLCGDHILYLLSELKKAQAQGIITASELTKFRKRVNSTSFFAASILFSVAIIIVAFMERNAHPVGAKVVIIAALSDYIVSMVRLFQFKAKFDVIQKRLK